MMLEKRQRTSAALPFISGLDIAAGTTADLRYLIRRPEEHHVQVLRAALRLETQYRSRSVSST